MLTTITNKLKAVLAMLWTVFSSITIIGGLLAILYFVGGRETFYWLNAMTWEKTNCQVHQARIVSYKKDKSTNYRLTTSYSFTDETDKYFGNRYDFSVGDGSSSRGPSAQAVRYLRNNQTVSCYYNPNDPEQSVIDRSFQLSFLFMLIPLILLALFGTMALGGLWRMITRKKRTKKQPLTPI